MLLATERTDVEAYLGQTLANENDPRGFLSNLFTGAVAQPLLLQLPTTLTKSQDYASFVIGYCLDSGWSQLPSMLERLLSRFVTAGAAKFTVMRDRVRLGIDPNPDIYMSRWIVAQQPFFARPNLRRFAKQLIESNDRPILCVNGPDGSGRAYTRRYFEYLMDNAPSELHVVYHEIPPKTGPSTQPDEIAGALTAPMRGAPEPPGRTSSSYSGALSRYVLRQAMNQTGKWIFALRGLHQEQMNPEVIELMQQLAKSISAGEYRKRLRLLLIDHPVPVPPLLLADVMEELIPKPGSGVCGGDILECLVEYNAGRRKAGQVPIEPGDLQQVADGILLGAPSDGKARLQYLYDELFKLRSMPAQV